jgi:glycosyltransferase involved in cell wall biosynthesis
LPGKPLTILFAAPAFWPAHAFGGPITVSRELISRLVAGGHTVDVVTTTLEGAGRGARLRSTAGVVDGASVRYAATPVRYRWVGVTPTLPLLLRRVRPPDVIHVYGYRDSVTTYAAAWARRRGIPYVFEPLGMFRARLRKVALKRLLDSTVYRSTATGAALVVVVSEREREDVIAGGVDPDRVVIRRNGFPEPPVSSGVDERARAGLPASVPLVLYAGRIAAGKGVEQLLAAARAIDGCHVALIGPDDGHGVMELVRAALKEPELAGRVHVLPPTPGTPFDLIRSADLLVLPSAGESFGMVAVEAASVGTPVLLTDRCGAAEMFATGEALVVPFDEDAIVQEIRRALTEPGLREQLSAGGRAAAGRLSWERVVELQEQLYRTAVAAGTSSSSTAR